jgi:hypothetical protein
MLLPDPNAKMPSFSRGAVMKIKALRFVIAMIFISVSAILVWQQESRLHSREASMNSDRSVLPPTFEQDVVCGTAGSVSPNWSELMGSMEKMHVAMKSVAWTGNSDVDFVRLMLPHHQAAVDMAETQLMYGKDPQMRRLAQEIITDQQSEIALMQLWLKRHEPQR